VTALESNPGGIKSGFRARILNKKVSIALLTVET